LHNNFNLLIFIKTKYTMATAQAFNLNKWIEENRHLLKPPVGNKNLYPEATDYIVMVVAGPNARKDFHYNQTEELFYQLEGNIVVKTQQDGKLVEVPLGPGDMFLLPPEVPHSPNRGEGSIGLVIERVRAGKGFTDGLMWFCEKCNTPLHEVKFELHNIEKDFLPHFKAFYGDETLRTCKSCGHVMESDPRFV
jgi:3-hydroxyanthranilate 3,4-dioxygenase